MSAMRSVWAAAPVVLVVMLAGAGAGTAMAQGDQPTRQQVDIPAPPKFAGRRTGENDLRLSVVDELLSHVHECRHLLDLIDRDQGSFPV